GIEWDWSPVGLSLLAQQLIFPPLAVAGIILAYLNRHLWLGALFVALPPANLLFGIILFTIAILIYGFCTRASVKGAAPARVAMEGKRADCDADNSVRIRRQPSPSSSRARR